MSDGERGALAPTARVWALLAVCLVCLAACRRADGAAGGRGSTLKAKLTVFAAASLTEAFTEIGAAFERERPDVEVAFNFAGSQQLAQQIVQGAPADVFASANEIQMEVVAQAGRLDAPPRVFAYNQLVVAVPGDNPAGLEGIADLVRPGLKLILAVPEVPAGRYARQFLMQANADPALGPEFERRFLENVVSYEENVRAVLSKVLLGEADAGLVYRSDLDGYGPSELALLEIPPALNPQARYPIATLAEGQDQESAGEFLGLVLSPAGQAILTRRGFLPAHPLEDR